MPFSDFIVKNKYLILFFSLLLLIIIPSFITSVFWSNLFNTLCMTLVYLSAMDVVLTRRRFVVTWIIVLAVLILLKWLSFAKNDIAIFFHSSGLLAFLFLAYIIQRLVKTILKAKEVSIDVIIGAISIYLLAGIMGGLAAATLNAAIPGAYSFPDGMAMHTNTFIYYSFTTMTTLGYGDIIPAVPQSHALAILLSLSGQLYVAVMIAILVGKYISRPSQRK